jgi:hypothetical protein
MRIFLISIKYFSLTFIDLDQNRDVMLCFFRKNLDEFSREVYKKPTIKIREKRLNGEKSPEFGVSPEFGAGV